MDVVSPILEISGASHVVNKLVDKATTYVRDQYYWKTDLQEELQNLRRLLPQIQVVVGFAEDRLTSYGSSNRALMEWLGQFRDGIDEAEDVLDELEYLELEKKANSDKNMLSRTVDASVKAAKRFLKVDDLLLERLRTCVKNLNASASNAHNFLAILGHTGGIGTGQMQQEILADQSRITSSLPEVSFKGREEVKGTIIQYLLGESAEESEIQSSENVHCLPLVAMGGMGKTTLAQQVFDHFKNVKKEHFDIKIWVCDSLPNLNASSLMKKILEDLNDKSESGPLERLPEKLKEKLHSKRFLLVLDDVWDDENKREWEKLCNPLLRGQKGSWILLTTRLRSVANMVSKEIKGTMEPMKLPGLSNDECRSLLYEHAFAGQDPSKFPLLKEIGEEIILKKLDGVPLLAKSIGGALNSKLTVDHWTSISRSELWKTPLDSKYEFIPVLTLSYKMLPPRLKRCFSYCSIFPQDYRFKKQKLVSMWVAAGLIYSEGSEEGSDEDIANCCFDMLCDKSFFDLHTYNRSLFWQRDFYDTAKDFYSMHDMLNSLACHVSRYECCRIVHGASSRILDYNAIRHISISISSTDAELHDLAKMVCKFKHLRTLRIEYDGHSQKLDDFIRDACKSPRRIRVLIMEYYLPDHCLKSISDFVKIRFLEIPTILPSLSMCKFYFLQVLIGYSDILAKDTNKLTNLRHLYQVRDDALRSVAKVGKLTSLQELCFAVGTEPGYRMDELMNMDNLSQLSIKQLSNVRSPEEANMIKLVKKCHLKELTLDWNGVSNLDEVSNPGLQHKVLAALQPPPTIRGLCIRHYEGGMPAPWMDTPSLSWLEYLQLDCCTSLEELPPLWKLPCLKVLKLNQMKAIRSLGCHFSNRMDIQFPVLEELQFYGLPLWEEWNGTDDCIWFPHLKSFTIHHCPKLKLGLESLSLISPSLSRLESLKLYACTSLEELPPLWKLPCLKFLKLNDMNAIRSLGCHFSNRMDIQFPVLEELEFCQLPLLEEWNGVDDYIWFPHLKRFEIENCPKLKKIPGLPLSIESLKMKDLGLEALPRSYNYKCSNGSKTFGGFQQLMSLKSLKIFNCPRIVQIGSIGEEDDNLLPSSLETLDLGILDKHEDLVSYLRGLTSLTDLTLSCSRSMTSLPLASELEHLTALRSLHILNSEALTSPGGLYILKSLKSLKISDCPKFLSAEVESQESSSVFDHSASNKAASILPSSLESLKFKNSDISQESLGRWLQGLTSLKSLEVSDSHHLVSLPNIEYLHNLTALQALGISDCKELCELESLTTLASLRYLGIKRCPKLLATTFSALQNPATTIEQSCTKKKKGTLPSLEEIDIDNIFYLLILPIPKRLNSLSIRTDIENPLVPLEFTCFPSEIEEWLLQCRESLEYLYWREMLHLQSLPERLESFSSLKVLRIGFAPKLKSLPRMPATLEQLMIYGCSAKLKKHCQENIGRDWPNINHIPYINITAGKEDKAEAQVNCNCINSRLWSST